MKQLHRESPLVLGIALYNRGFAFALIHDAKLVDWGLALLNGDGDKNQWAVERFKRLMSQWNPDMVVFEDALAKDSRRTLRLRRLMKGMMIAALKGGFKVKAISSMKLAKI